MSFRGSLCEPWESHKSQIKRRLTALCKSANGFGKVLALGLTVNFATYVFINIAMVMGLLPVVGVPLPLVSYGGTAMLTLMIGFGFIECSYVNREMVIGRLGVFDD